MKIKYSVLGWVVCAVLASGCTHSLYQGELEVKNSQDQPRKAVIYWTKTDKFIGKDTAGPAKLMTECSTRELTFVERGTGLYFFGTPALDRFPNQLKPIKSPNILCGRIVNEMRFKTIEPGPIQVDIRCFANIDEQNVDNQSASPAYIKPSRNPYIFEITETSDWGFSTEPPAGPSAPACRESK